MPIVLSRCYDMAPVAVVARLIPARNENHDEARKKIATGRNASWSGKSTGGSLLCFFRKCDGPSLVHTLRNITYIVSSRDTRVE